MIVGRLCQTAAATRTNRRTPTQPTRSFVGLRMYDGIFLFHPPRRDFAKKIARGTGDVFGFRHAAFDQCASSTCPDLSHNQRAIFANNSPEMLDGRGSSKSPDGFR